VTLGQLVTDTGVRLAAAGCVSAQAEARWLVEEAAGLEPGRLALLAGEQAGPGVQARLEAMAARRAAGEPLQYVVGWAPFGPLRIAVGAGVFVPRPETETLAERAAAHLRGSPGRVAVDLCTGSGAIACYLAAEVTGARVLATELDPVAVAWALRNAEPLGVQVLTGDLDAPLLAAVPELAGRVDVVTANVPYVPTGQLALLPSDVREHEPAVSLDGGPDGLDVLRRVLGLAGRWLAPGGWILCEIGDDQGPAAVALAAEAGLAGPAVRADLVGRDRILEGQWRPATSRERGSPLAGSPTTLD
jgi:release factor glutamine methyltransferase